MQSHQDPTTAAWPSYLEGVGHFCILCTQHHYVLVTPVLPIFPLKAGGTHLVGSPLASRNVAVWVAGVTGSLCFLVECAQLTGTGSVTCRHAPGLTGALGTVLSWLLSQRSPCPRETLGRQQAGPPPAWFPSHHLPHISRGLRAPACL